MALYLIQHGKSLPKDQDPDQGLSAEGKVETQRIAEVAKGYAVKVSRIVHSGKKRARQTAELFAAALSPENGIDTRSDMNPLDDVREFASQLPMDQNVMLVGHLPFMERLIGFLVCGNPDQLVFKVQNSGVVCLDQVPQADHAVIRWALMPSIT